MNNITPTPTIPVLTDSIDSKIESPHITNIRLNQPINHVDSNVTQNQSEPDSSNTINILPYALLLLIIIISVIIYVKYH